MRVVHAGTAKCDAQLALLAARGDADDLGVASTVREILDAVRQRGDAAVCEYTTRFDRVTLTPERMAFSRDDYEKAYRAADPRVVEALRYAAERIRSFHQRQVRQGYRYEAGSGISLGQIIRPLAAAGIYVPGGKAAYPSTVLMNAIPAKVAGVERVVMVSPTPGGEVNPHILVAADLAGVDVGFRIGGAQAVAALAWGTASVPRVDTIVGPGNIYVATAKKMVFGQVNIDMIAGPSEILVIADDSAHPAFVAADLLSQAEHDELASAILVTPSEDLAKAVEKQVAAQLKVLPRVRIAKQSIKRFGTIIITASLEEAVQVANRVAPEHLELAVADPEALLPAIHNAGAVFLGHYTPEAIGDYVAGPDHVLPTGGTARFSSPLNVDDFIKKTSVIRYGRQAFLDVADTCKTLSDVEGLTAHSHSVTVRLQTPPGELPPG
ncbi:MAG: histidinol dehydrogenase [Nitrospirota bacterium]|nr:histidinol dehydrogenase [Nitrospirota bacterium]